MSNKEKLAMYILTKAIEDFYKKSPSAIFEDVPNSVFIDTMIKYGKKVSEKRFI